MPRIQNHLGFLARRHPLHLKEKNKKMTMSQGGSLSFATPKKKKQINDDEPRKLAVIYYT